MCLSASSFKFSLANFLSVRTVGLQEWECGGEEIAMKKDGELEKSLRKRG